MIETANEIYEGNRHLNSFSDWYRRWTRKPFNPSVFYLGMKLEARINQGRWVIDCPFCKGAETIWPGEPWFLCAACRNNGTDLAIRVELPKNKAKIEEALDKRPEPENRNWTPGETLSDLKTENEKQGVK